MKSTIYAIIAVLLYAIQNSIIDVRLKSYSTIGIMLSFSMVTAPIILGLFFWQRTVDNMTALPIAKECWLLVAVAIIFIIADYLYIGAFTSGGDAVSITTILILMPVISALIKYVWVRETPTPFHVAGFICAACAVMFVTLGNQKPHLQKEVVVTATTS